MDTSFFQVENLAISFGGIKALQDISFTMYQGFTNPIMEISGFRVKKLITRNLILLQKWV